MIGRIELKNMAFFGYHGVFPGEERAGQRFFVDVVITTDIYRAATTDDLAAAIDYSAVFEVCRRVVEGPRVALLETLCHRLISALLDRFATIGRVEVTVRKPSAPIAGVLDYVAVQASVDRAENSDRTGE